MVTDGNLKLASSGKMGDYFEHNGRLRKARGLGWVLAAFFVVADMAGGGIVALPTAVVRCRECALFHPPKCLTIAEFWPGLVMLTCMAFISTFSAVMLGKCWEILIRRFPVYRTHCRKPYAEIGYRAFGSWMRWGRTNDARLKAK